MYLLLMLFCTPISMIYQCTEKLESDDKNLQYQVTSKQTDYTYFIKKKILYQFLKRELHLRIQLSCLFVLGFCVALEKFSLI